MIKVLIVDDSAVVRQVLKRELAQAEDIEVVGTAIDPYVARNKIHKFQPDVLTLDLEMPRMEGLTFLAKLMKYHPLPVIVVSSLSPHGSETAMRALELGAVDVVSKPSDANSVGELSATLIEKIRAAATIRFSRPVAPPEPPPAPEPAPTKTPTVPIIKATPKILAIGASTGGTEAIREVLMGLPSDICGTVIVQHMPERFTSTFAKRLNDLCPMEVREAKSGDAVVPGLALVAPGNWHMVLRRNGSRYTVEVKGGPAVHHQRPSVDVLFHSMATQAGANAVGVILTGMGGDGAKGLLAMREAGARTIAQDEKSCVVFGMPKEAIRLEAVEQVASLQQIPQRIMDALKKKPPQTLAG